MMEIVVPLARQYQAHGDVFSSVTVREPRFEDLLALGEPYEVQRTPQGGRVVIENTPAVAAYVKRCVIKPTSDHLGELDIKDARAVRNAVLDFFTHGEQPPDSQPKT
ncbi:hypothetical protein [Aminobacter niigataensis]|uniref:hypothetical protein n=1 Tax=Aminobacter niigataensis TaxID=83265 RepID=UPI0024C830BB|nr:hypothetical protein [Aminobacter niigataensis]CAI2936157.1 conserved protein of unknown function [Aminobacter niigataensis]